MPDLAYYLACVNEEELSEKYISPGYAFIQAMRKLHEGMIFPENACPKGRAGCFPLLITAPAVMFQKGSDEQLVSCIDNMVAMTHKDNRVFDAARAFAFILKSALQDRPVSEDEKIALIEKIAAVPGFFSGTKIPEVLYKIKDFYKLSFHEMSKNITNLGLIEDGFMHCTYYVVPLLAAVLTIWVKYSSNPHKALGACICLSGASDSAAFLCAQLFGACNIDIIPAQARGIIKNEDQIKDLLGRFSLLCPGH
jgi:ADP-ribosylglycohydrolase